jgi:hypothetical protein
MMSFSDGSSVSELLPVIHFTWNAENVASNTNADAIVDTGPVIFAFSIMLYIVEAARMFHEQYLFK